MRYNTFPNSSCNKQQMNSRKKNDGEVERVDKAAGHRSAGKDMTDVCKIIQRKRTEFSLLILELGKTH